VILIWACVGRYSAHRVRRQASGLSLFTADESLLLDLGLDYRSIDGLSSEIRPDFFTPHYFRLQDAARRSIGPAYRLGQSSVVGDGFDERESEVDKRCI
jgi:hypothetical protein